MNIKNNVGVVSEEFNLGDLMMYIFGILIVLNAILFIYGSLI